MKLRPIVGRDHSDCLAIYRANFEQGLIPDHYEPEFLETLEDPDTLTLLMQDGDDVVGCGSIHYLGSHAQAHLAFGLIHPSRQRRGYGSRLLVARIALLRENHGNTTVTLCATENSVGFYEKVVGFHQFSRETDKHGNRFHWLELHLTRELLKMSQDCIDNSDVELASDLAVPVKRDLGDF